MILLQVPGHEVCCCWSLATLCQLLSWNVEPARLLVTRGQTTLSSFPQPHIQEGAKSRWCPVHLLLHPSPIWIPQRVPRVHSRSSYRPWDTLLWLVTQWEHRCFCRLGLKVLHWHGSPPPHPPPPFFTLNYLVYIFFFFFNKQWSGAFTDVFSFKSSSGLLTWISSLKTPSAPPSGSRLPGNPP